MYRQLGHAAAFDRQCYRRLADPQQRAGPQLDRRAADRAAVERDAVGRAQVAHQDAGVVAVVGDQQLGVQAGDVRVVDPDVGVRAAADPDRDLAAGVAGTGEARRVVLRG